jgi:hypothetical protein
MPHFNLTQRENRKPETLPYCKFAFGKSASGNLELTGGQAADYTSHFCEYLNSYIPESWQTELNTLFQAELELLQKRRDFVASCRAEVPKLLGHLPAQYKAEHPELFI